MYEELAKSLNGLIELEEQRRHLLYGAIGIVAGWSDHARHYDVSGQFQQLMHGAAVGPPQRLEPQPQQRPPNKLKAAMQAAEYDDGHHAHYVSPPQPAPYAAPPAPLPAYDYEEDPLRIYTSKARPNGGAR
jgi:hypothetical protein